MQVFYPAEISRDPDTDYGVSFPDFPGCITTGPNVAAALRDAEEAGWPVAAPPRCERLGPDGVAEEGDLA